MRSVTVEAATVQQALVLRMTGELTGATAPDTTRSLLAATDVLPPPSLVVLDMRELEVLWAGGLSAIRDLARTLGERGVRCHMVITPDSAVARTFDIAHPSVAIPRFTELPEALTDPNASEPGGRQHDDLLLGQFETLTRVLLGTTSVGVALQRIVDAATVVVTHSDLVSVTLRSPDGKYLSPLSTGEVAAELDQVQYAAGAGPCVDAARPDGPGYTVSDDLHRERRWREFTAAAVGHGYGALLATSLIPVSGSDQPSGALNIYSRRAHGLTAADRHAALLLATHASLALAHAHKSELGDLRLAQFQCAVDSRDVIGQAKGILMHRQGITADEAFALLRRTSQDLNVKLVDLARTIASRHDELGLP